MATVSKTITLADGSTVTCATDTATGGFLTLSVTDSSASTPTVIKIKSIQETQKINQLLSLCAQVLNG